VNYTNWLPEIVSLMISFMSKRRPAHRKSEQRLELWAETLIWNERTSHRRNHRSQCELLNTLWSFFLLVVPTILIHQPSPWPLRQTEQIRPACLMEPASRAIAGVNMPVPVCRPVRTDVVVCLRVCVCSHSGMQRGTDGVPLRHPLTVWSVIPTSFLSCHLHTRCLCS